MSKKQGFRTQLFLRGLKLLPFSLALVSLQAHAFASIWTSAANTSWTVGANWNTNPFYPGLSAFPFDSAFIGSAGTVSPVVITSLDPALTLNALAFTSAGPTYTVTNSGSLTINNLVAGFGVGTVNAGVTSQITNVNSGILNFLNAAGASVPATLGTVIIENGVNGFTTFQNTSTANNAIIRNTAASGTLTFMNNSTAATASIDNKGKVDFQNANANVGATATVLNTGAGSTIDISNAFSGSIQIGSLSETVAGAGITLGGKKLILGGLNLNDQILSVISGPLGSSEVEKVGTGTLILTGTNTYAGLTTITGGTLQIGNGGLGSVAGNILNNAALVFDRSIAPATYAGVISGTGTVTQTGLGTLIFTGNNTYTGLTSILLGELQLGNGGTTGEVVSNIFDNSSLVFNRSDAVTYGGVISGNGTVTKLNTNDLVFTADHTYTGLTTIAAGTLRLGNGGATGSVTGNILDNGTLIFNQNIGYVYGGLISGTGNVVKLNAASVMTFTADNTYTGGTIITGGTLRLGNGGATGSVVGDIVDNGTLIFNRNSNLTFGGLISGTGDVVKLNAASTLTFTGNNTYTGGTTVASGILQLGNGGTTGSVVGNIANAANITINRSNAYVYNDVISGAGTLTKIAAGTFTLNGANTYTGDTNINAGTLVLGDATHPAAAVGGSVIVAAGSVLRGRGTIGQNLTNNGEVFPGNSIGTITILGNYIQGATGSYIVELDQAGNSDLLNVTGTATLNGLIGVEGIQNGFLLNYPYTIITAGGGVIGNFSNAPPPSGTFNQNFLQGMVTYLPNAVQLRLHYNADAFLRAALTPNQIAVANYLLTSGSTAAVQSLIASITNDTRFRAALDQISGATYANNDLMITRVGNWFSGEMADRFDAFPSCNCYTSLLQPDNEVSCDQKNQFWIAAHGAKEDIESGDVSGLNTNVGNLALGYEWGVGNTSKMGVAAAYSSFSASAQQREMASTDGGLYQIGLYTRSQMGNWLVGIALDGGVTTQMKTDRQIQAVNSIVTTKGNSKASLYSGQVRVAYDLTPTTPVRFAPFLGVIGQQLTRGNFTENTNTGFELNVDGSTYHSTRSQLGALLEVPTNSSFKPFASLDWEHEFADVNSTFNANLVGVGGKFHIQGQSIGRDSAVIKAGTVLSCGRDWNVSVLYQGWYGNGWQENGATLRATMVFG